jgi:hypothetical protein
MKCINTHMTDISWRKKEGEGGGGTSAVGSS